MRGDDLLGSTPRQVLLQRLLGPTDARSTCTSRWSSAPTASAWPSATAPSRWPTWRPRASPRWASAAACRRHSASTRTAGPTDFDLADVRRRGRSPSRSPSCNDPGRERGSRRACTSERERRARRPGADPLLRRTPSTSRSGCEELGPDLLVVPFWTPSFCRAVVRAAGLVGFAPDPDDPVPGHEVPLVAISPQLHHAVEEDLGRRIWPQLQAVWPLIDYHGLRDAFVIRYAMGEQESLRPAPRRRPGVGDRAPRRRSRGRRAAVPAPGRRHRRACPSARCWRGRRWSPTRTRRRRCGAGVRHGLTIWFELPAVRLPDRPTRRQVIFTRVSRSDQVRREPLVSCRRWWPPRVRALLRDAPGRARLLVAALTGLATLAVGACSGSASRSIDAAGGAAGPAAEAGDDDHRHPLDHDHDRAADHDHRGPDDHGGPTTTAPPTTTTTTLPPLPPSPAIEPIAPMAAPLAAVGEQQRRRDGTRAAAPARPRLLAGGRRRPVRAHHRQAVMAFQKYVGLTASGSRRRRRPAAYLSHMTEQAYGRADAGTLVEVDKARQLMFMVVDGRTQWVFNTSTGSEVPYVEVNQKDPTKVEEGTRSRRPGCTTSTVSARRAGGRATSAGSTGRSTSSVASPSTAPAACPTTRPRTVASGSPSRPWTSSGMPA